MALTPVTVPPVTLNDGESAAKSTTGRSKASSTWTVSPAPLWKAEVRSLSGASAKRSRGWGASTYAGTADGRTLAWNADPALEGILNDSFSTPVIGSTWVMASSGLSLAAW